MKYPNSKIYRLVCNETGDQYIGSTCDDLSARKAKHCWDARNGKKPTKSKDIILREDFDIILIEAYPCSNIEELRSRERRHIENNECVNRKIPNRNPKEWWQDTKDIRLEKHREYRKNHREQEREYQNTKYSCEICGGKFTRANRQQHGRTKKHLSTIIKNGSAT